MKKIEFQAMGCGMSAILDNKTPEAKRLLARVPAWFEEWEAALSRFRTGSNLSRLNGSAGKAFEVGPILWDVVHAALDTARWTGGLVIPAILKSVERAGYDQSFDLLQSGKVEHPNLLNVTAQANEKTAATGWQDIQLDELSHTIFLPVGLKLDLGGIAKGWAAQQAMRRLQDYGPALVDASGDIAVSGNQADGQSWVVDIADPLQVEENLGLLVLGKCGVATSGIDYHRWLQDGTWRHHIIDPRSGEPAETDLMSVTVIAPDVMLAEAAAKVVLILGSQVGLEWLEKQPQLSGLLAFQDGRLLYSNHMQDYLWSNYVSENDIFSR
jgi:thiamine biosynthesis lipoprotein